MVIFLVNIWQVKAFNQIKSLLANYQTVKCFYIILAFPTYPENSAF